MTVLLDLMGATPGANTVNGMDLIFGTKDVIMICSGIVILITAFITIKLQQRNLSLSLVTYQAEFNKDIALLTNQLLDAKNGRHAIRKQINEDVKEKIDVVHARIDKVQVDIKTNQDNNNNEFKEINKSLNKIIGMLEGNTK